MLKLLVLIGPSYIVSKKQKKTPPICMTPFMDDPQAKNYYTIEAACVTLLLVTLFML